MTTMQLARGGGRFDFLPGVPLIYFGSTPADCRRALRKPYTDAELDEVLPRLRASREAQGLPMYVTDPVALAPIARALRRARDTQPDRDRSGSSAALLHSA